MAGVELEMQGQNNEQLNGVISDIGSSAHAVSHPQSAVEMATNPREVSQCSELVTKHP